MKEAHFNFSKEPGKILQKEKYNNEEAIISIIMPFYNDKKYIRQAVNSVLNQTFPCFELLIIDDGSEDEESLKELEIVSKLDKRIKVLHKENEGASAARDYGVNKSDRNSKYIVFLDSDDMFEKTYLECAYWTLETNTKASWAYTDSIGFEGNKYLWSKWFDSDKMKKENSLVLSSMVRKKDFLEVNGFEIKEKGVYEDWNLWLKLIAKGKFPVRMNFYGMWYRRKLESSELTRAKQNKARAMEIIKNTARTIEKRVEAIQYPKYDYNWDEIIEELPNIQYIKKEKTNKINILMIVPWMVMGGADKYNLDLVSKLDKEKFDITIISTEIASNEYRQSFEEHTSVYDLTTFIDQKYWIAFINYIIKKNNINLIFNTNSETGYALLPYLKNKYPEVPIIDYIHMEEWYNRNGGYSRDSSSVSSVIDKTLVCNENSRKILIDHFKRDEKELQTVYIGVDEEKYNPKEYNKEELKEKYKLPKDKYIISYICRITEQKRPFLLLEVIKKLKETRKDFQVLIVGDGNLLSKIKSKAKGLESEGYIKFLGRIEKTDEIYAISDMTINCSIKEGLALTAYESLSMGVPVISSDVGGQKELINKETGIIVPCIQKEEDIFDINYSEGEINSYVEGIEKILNNLEKYKSNCRRRILSGFTIKQMVENMSKILEEVTKEPKEEKKQNGKNIPKDIVKELVTKQLVNMQIQYEWQSEEYNKQQGHVKYDYRFQLFKERMWEHKWYRAIIKLMQKTGIMKVIKERI